MFLSYIYFYYFILCTLVHWHARTLPTREAASGGFSGVQTIKSNVEFPQSNIPNIKHLEINSYKDPLD